MLSLGLGLVSFGLGLALVLNLVVLLTSLNTGRERG